MRVFVTASSAVSGSSSSNARGLVTSARASATLCRSPPDMSDGRRSKRPDMPNDSAISLVRPSRSRRSSEDNPYSMFCLTRHVWEQRQCLKQIADMPPVRGKIDSLFRVEEHGVVHRNATGIRVLQSGNAVQDGCLAGARGAEQNCETGSNGKSNVQLKRVLSLAQGSRPVSSHDAQVPAEDRASAPVTATPTVPTCSCGAIRIATSASQTQDQQQKRSTIGDRIIQRLNLVVNQESRPSG